MITNSETYSNPVVPSGFYFMKVIEIEGESSNSNLPKLLIRLQAHPHYHFENIIFSSILHPTPHSIWHYNNFRNTFLLWKTFDDLEEAVGPWGSVRLDKSKYVETEYSSVRFVYQPLPVRMKSWEIQYGKENSV